MNIDVLSLRTNMNAAINNIKPSLKRKLMINRP